MESDYDEVVLEEEEDDKNVEDVEVGDRVEEQDAERDDDDDDDDWLYEGLEGDDIFAAPNSAPQGFAPKSSDAPNIALEASNAPHVVP